MEQLVQYDSDSESIATTIADSISTLEDTQLVGELEDGVTQIQETQPDAQIQDSQPVQPEADPTVAILPPLPPKPNRKSGRSVRPRGNPPKKNHGWNITRTQNAIRRCQLPGQWYQGGMNDRITFTNDAQTYYVHQHSNSMWVQGQEDTVINARLLGSVGAR